MYFLTLLSCFFKFGAGRENEVPDRCKQEDHLGVDLIIADIPENLPVPSVSVPPTSIPPWNSRYKDYLYDIFHFADEFLQKDGAICLIYNTDQKLAKDIEEEAANGGYVLFKDWWGVNVLGLTSPTNPENLVISLNIPFSLLIDNPSA